MSNKPWQFRGLANNLTEYGDKEFALFLRRSFAKAMGLGEKASTNPSSGLSTPTASSTTATAVSRAGRGGKARRLAGGRPSAGIPHHLPGRDLPRAHQDALSQPHGDGRRGHDRGAAARRRGADGGCDKTAPPAMGAASADCRRSSLVAGPMLTGQYQGSGWAPAPTAAASGRGTGATRSAPSRLTRPRAQLAPTPGTCSVMGTASTWPA